MSQPLQQRMRTEMRCLSSGGSRRVQSTRRRTCTQATPKSNMSFRTAEGAWGISGWLVQSACHSDRREEWQWPKRTWL